LIKITGIDYEADFVKIQVTYDHEGSDHLLEKNVPIYILLGLTEAQIITAVKNQVATARRSQDHVTVENKLASLMNVDLEV